MKSLDALLHGYICREKVERMKKRANVRVNTLTSKRSCEYSHLTNTYKHCRSRLRLSKRNTSQRAPKVRASVGFVNETLEESQIVEDLLCFEREVDVHAKDRN